MNKRVSFILIVIFLFGFVRSGAYNKSDLELIRTKAAVSELFLSFPLWADKFNNKKSILSNIYLPAAFLEECISAALEKEGHMVSLIASLVRSYDDDFIKMMGGLTGGVVVLFIKKFINKKLNDAYPQNSDRVRRRVLRVMVLSFFIFWVCSICNQQSRLNMYEDFFATSIGLVIVECIGEKIIQNVKEEHQNIEEEKQPWVRKRIVAS